MFREFLADRIYPEGRERRDQAERAADTDALTGLGNRRALDRALPAAEADTRTAIVLFDANNFGQVNKLKSHAAGDRLLCEMAATLQLAAKRFGCGGRVFRSGGDEFVVLAPASWANRLRDAAEKEFGQIECGEIAVSLSGNIGQTLAEADRSLQSRKRQRKAAVQLLRAA